ncbi:MAG: hypothetical protein P1U58_01445 [Verrucomicrobiales bacterium]|nr:hypothetical protein [Verrucomicrobiales bacterium]
MQLTTPSPTKYTSTSAIDPASLVARLNSSITAVRCVCLSLRTSRKSSDEFRSVTSIITFLEEIEEELPKDDLVNEPPFKKVSLADLLCVWGFELDVICDRIELSKIDDEVDTLVRLQAELCRLLADIVEDQEEDLALKAEFVGLADLVSCDALYFVTGSGDSLAKAA